MDVQPSGHPNILLYHKIDTSWEFGITRTTPNGFRRHLTTLAALKYTPVSLQALFSSSETVPHPTNSRLGLTFDDGYVSVFENALPLLIQFGATATVFIPSDFIGKSNRWDSGRFGRSFRHMDRSQLAESMRYGNEIGSHSASHRHLKVVPHRQRDREIHDSRKCLEDLTGHEVDWFAPPYGWYDHDVIERCVEAGYKGIAVVESTTISHKEFPIHIAARTPVYLGDGPTLLRAKLNPAHPLHGFERARLRSIRLGNIGNLLVQSLTAELRKEKSSLP